MVIRFYTGEPNKISVPYSPYNGWGGCCKYSSPFKGNGYIDATNGLIIPEYWCYGNVKVSKQYCAIKNGAEMYIGNTEQTHCENDKNMVK